MGGGREGGTDTQGTMVHSIPGRHRTFSTLNTDKVEKVYSETVTLCHLPEPFETSSSHTARPCVAGRRRASP